MKTETLDHDDEVPRHACQESSLSSSGGEGQGEEGNVSKFICRRTGTARKPTGLRIPVASCASCGIVLHMKRNLRILALVVAVAGIITWLALGANRGWTRTSDPVKTVDAVTGLERIDYQKRFIPGLDLLGGALLGAGVLAGVSLAFRKPQT